MHVLRFLIEHPAVVLPVLFVVVLVLAGAVLLTLPKTAPRLRRVHRQNRLHRLQTATARDIRRRTDAELERALVGLGSARRSCSQRGQLDLADEIRRLESQVTLRRDQLTTAPAGVSMDRESDYEDVDVATLVAAQELTDHCQRLGVRAAAGEALQLDRVRDSPVLAAPPIGLPA